MNEWPPFVCKDDLAPGDREPHPRSPSGLSLHRITSYEDPLFERVFTALWDQFGDAREMENRTILQSRLNWNGEQIRDGKHFHYHLQAILQNDTIVGMRDHTIIAHPNQGPVVVHMSHVLIPEDWRRMGIATLLRTLPVADARTLAAEINRPNAPILLFCEMDLLDLTYLPNRIRRQSYERAGFKGIPGGHGYIQPDFHGTTTPTAKTQPVELDLLFRLVDNELQEQLPHEELVQSIEHIYSMYSEGIPENHMRPCRQWLAQFRTSTQQNHPLVSPTKTS